MDRETLVEQLHRGTCEVVFEKVDGEKRTMTCTLNPEIANMPEQLHEQSNRAKNPNVIAVWDLNANGWRSFRVDSVESFNSVNRTLTEG
tara:strand:+ start:541 stop:807 length:267 start_codon:yes stop_codon:yes gene_type:complete